MRGRWLAAAACAGMMVCATVAADQPRTDPQAPVADKPDPTLTPRDLNEREQEYLGALKKCEPLPEKERQDCARAVKGKFGVM